MNHLTREWYIEVKYNKNSVDVYIVTPKQVRVYDAADDDEDEEEEDEICFTDCCLRLICSW